MPVPYTRNMTQEATYWPPEEGDGFGGVVFGAPRIIRCRWQDEAVLFRDVQGRELTSSSVVYPAEELTVRGYLALGDFSYVSDPQGLASAFEVRQITKSPSLDGVRELNKVFL